jgi:hypothetical protein
MVRVVADTSGSKRHKRDKPQLIALLMADGVSGVKVNEIMKFNSSETITFTEASFQNEVLRLPRLRLAELNLLAFRVDLTVENERRPANATNETDPKVQLGFWRALTIAAVLLRGAGARLPAVFDSAFATAAGQEVPAVPLV